MFLMFFFYIIADVFTFKFFYEGICRFGITTPYYERLQSQFEYQLHLHQSLAIVIGTHHIHTTAYNHHRVTITMELSKDSRELLRLQFDAMLQNVGLIYYSLFYSGLAHPSNTTFEVSFALLVYQENFRLHEEVFSSSRIYVDGCFDRLQYHLSSVCGVPTSLSIDLLLCITHFFL